MERERRINFTYEELGEEFKGHSEAEDLKAVADFFALKSSHRQMQKLTGLSERELERVLEGDLEESRHRAHSAILAAFARTSKVILEENSSEDQEINNKGMKQWLDKGEVITSEGARKPIDVLSSSGLAMEAFEDIRAEMQRGGLSN